MPELPWYPDIVNRLQDGSSLLDIGCCFGQDLRFLAADGVPTVNMYASDIVSAFWDLSFDLFRDKPFFNAHFIEADILDAESPLKELKGEVGILLANQVFHLFNRERQVAMAKSLVYLGTMDAWIVGWQVGSSRGRPLPVATQTGGHSGSAGSDTKLFHNDQTWQELWQQVGEETGTKWSVETSMQPLEEWGYEKEDTAWMGPGATALHPIKYFFGLPTRVIDPTTRLAISPICKTRDSTRTVAGSFKGRRYVTLRLRVTPPGGLNLVKYQSDFAHRGQEESHPSD
ncbi:MAG: hypothetical protein Q9199_000780 [Rusavskia elegans]